jgi:GT2 family glycosyltransferase
VRRTLGALLLDRPRLAWPLWVPLARRRWEEFHNRNERLAPNPDGRGFDCDWKWTSDLNLCRTIPATGRRLMKLAFEEWPIRLSPDRNRLSSPENPEVSFVIGHRGHERLPHLLTTLESIAGQTGPPVECIVVEQDEDPRIGSALPGWVKYVPLKVARPGIPYCRSWVFNVGARVARGAVLVFHDNDIVVPAGYAKEIGGLCARGWEGARLQRFVFYLDENSTVGLLAGSGEVPGGSPELVRQNCQGHSIAVTREAYFQLGGHDEGFVGWGGEDNEFFDRCGLLRFHRWGYLPFLHLWHAPQPEKVKPAEALDYLSRASVVPASDRARRLAALPFGSPTGPAPGLEALEGAI